jgi:agmatine deiminase
MNILPHETNTLFLADTLPKYYPRFFRCFSEILTEEGVSYRLLPHTKDVWARDYMPLQVDQNTFVQFSYAPSYLKTAADRSTISDVDLIVADLGIRPTKSSIIIDGGNVVYTRRKAILSSRVFRDNPQFKKEDVCSAILDILNLEEVIIIPESPDDLTGHADGMLRFIDDDTVLMNDFSQEPASFREALDKTLKSHGLKTVILPYQPYQNIHIHQANGVYINYLQMQDKLFFPVFGLKEDEMALSIVSKVFPKDRIIPVDCNDIARDGGILHCITWNIKQ